jgi:hypothetical protein
MACKDWHTIRIRHVRNQRLSRQNIAGLGGSKLGMPLDGGFVSVKHYIRETIQGCAMWSHDAQ